MRSDKPLPKPGTGAVGFGCTFIVAMAAGIPAVLGEQWPAWLVVTVIAIALGLIAARTGESFFERLLESFRWW